VGVGLATRGTTSVRFPAGTEFFIFTITCRLAGTHSPSNLMREITPFSCLKRPVHRTITHLSSVEVTNMDMIRYSYRVARKEAQGQRCF
jgi:hypothetical protein